MNEIKVSVIMPVYNSGEYLKTAVESILNQSLREIELILVDDGSTDGSSEKCDEYAAKDSRVVVIHEKNGGICAARNAALAIAHGEYIGFSDHDDDMEYDTFNAAYLFAKSNNLDMTKYGHDEVITRMGGVVKRKCFSFKRAIYSPEEAGLHYLEMLRDMAMDCIWDGVFRKSFLDRYHLRLDTSFKAGGEDIDFCGRVIACRPRVGLMPQVFYHHFIRVGFSTSSKFNGINLSKSLSFPKRLNEYLKSYNAKKIFENDCLLYTYTIMRRTVGPLLHTAVSGNLSQSKVNSLLSQIRKDENIDPICYQTSIFDLFGKTKKYGILYFAFKNHWYSLCREMYKSKKK